MAFTRFNYDDCRTIKHLQQATDPGKWILNVPGNGSNPYFFEDPYIIPQKWGANLRTNAINIESSLKGINHPKHRDCLEIDNYKKYNVSSQPITYPTYKNSFTEQSRTTNPAWWYKDLEQVDWYYPPINPQLNTCLSFENNLSTRILEKDYYNIKNPCNKTF